MMTARIAPSIFNSQPWHWQIDRDRLVLSANLTRQIPVVDPQARLLTLSCGASLHHACVELAACGYHVDIRRAADLSAILAEVRIRCAGNADAAAIDLAQAAWSRHTDRRPFALGSIVPPEQIAFVTSAARTSRVSVDDITGHRAFLATAASAAEFIERRDPAYRAALADWVGHTDGTRTGVPLETVTPPVPRPVQLRDYAPRNVPGQLNAGTGDDTGATYLAISTRTDTVADWLAAGEATSAVLLATTHLQLASSPMSGVIEVPGARALIRSLVPGHLQPQLVIRIGVPNDVSPPPASPRGLPEPP